MVTTCNPYQFTLQSFFNESACAEMQSCVRTSCVKHQSLNFGMQLHCSCPVQRPIFSTASSCSIFPLVIKMVTRSTISLLPNIFRSNLLSQWSSTGLSTTNVALIEVATTERVSCRAH